MLQVSERYFWRESEEEFCDEEVKVCVSDKSYDAKVNVFEDRQRAWFLDVATRLTAKGTSPEDYVALSIAVGYIEGIQQYIEGDATQGKSRSRFTKSAKRIFPS